MGSIIEGQGVIKGIIQFQCIELSRIKDEKILPFQIFRIKYARLKGLTFTLHPQAQIATSALHPGTFRELPRLKTSPSPESKANCLRRACGKPHIL